MIKVWLQWDQTNPISLSAQKLAHFVSCHVAMFPIFVGVKKIIELVSGFESKCQSIVGSLIDSDPYGMVTVKKLYKIILGLLTKGFFFFSKMNKFISYFTASKL